MIRMFREGRFHPGLVVRPSVVNDVNLLLAGIRAADNAENEAAGEREGELARRDEGDRVIGEGEAPRRRPHHSLTHGTKPRGANPSPPLRPRAPGFEPYS